MKSTSESSDWFVILSVCVFAVGIVIKEPSFTSSSLSRKRDTCIVMLLFNYYNHKWSRYWGISTGCTVHAAYRIFCTHTHTHVRFERKSHKKLTLFNFLSTQNSSWSCWRTRRGPWMRCLWGLTASLTCRTRRSLRTCLPSWSAITPEGTLTWRKCLMTFGRGYWSVCSRCSTRSMSSLRTIWSVSVSTPTSSSPLETCPGSSRLRLPGHLSPLGHLSKGSPLAGRWPRECLR